MKMELLLALCLMEQGARWYGTFHRPVMLFIL